MAVQRLLYRLHHANPIVAQVEAEAAIGSSALLQDKTAFLAELSSLKVLPALKGRMNSAILIAPNLLLMQPKGLKEMWAILATNLAQDSPEACIISIRWRRSCNAGRQWVRPEAAQQDLKHRILLAKLRDQGRPGLDEDQS